VNHGQLQHTTRVWRAQQPAVPFTEPLWCAAAAGDLTFNPEKDTLVGADGKEISLDSPFGDELPAAGFDPGMDTYQAPPEPESRSRVQVRGPPHARQCMLFVLWVFGRVYGSAPSLCCCPA
jgi:hypothetical protein